MVLEQGLLFLLGHVAIALGLFHKVTGLIQGLPQLHFLDCSLRTDDMQQKSFVIEALGNLLNKYCWNSPQRLHTDIPITEDPE